MASSLLKQSNGTSTVLVLKLKYLVVNHLWIEACFTNWRKESESRIQYLTFPSGLNEIVGDVGVCGVDAWVQGVREGEEFLQEDVGGRSSGLDDNSADVSGIVRMDIGDIAESIETAEKRVIAEKEDAVVGLGLSKVQQVNEADIVKEIHDKVNKVEPVKEDDVAALIEQVNDDVEMKVVSTIEDELKETAPVEVEDEKIEEASSVLHDIEKMNEASPSEQDFEEDVEMKEAHHVEEEDVEMNEAPLLDDQDVEEDELNAYSQDINVMISKQPKAEKKRNSRALKPASARKAGKRVSIALDEDDTRPAKKLRSESRTSIKSTKVPVTPGCEPGSSVNITSSGTRSSSRRSICKGPVKVMFTGRVVDDKTRKVYSF